MPEGSAVQRMFSGIASRYDFANRVLSLGLCVGWRDQLVDAAKAADPKSVADLATGSGDVAFALRRTLPADCAIIGYDFCEPMLELGRIRAKKENIALEFKTGDCMSLPIADASQDVVTIAYGVRNFEDRAKGLGENTLLFRHAFRLAVLPVVSYSGPMLADLLTGSFIIENIFQIPGIGVFLVNSSLNRDYTVVVGLALLYAVLLVGLNLLVDAAYTWLDPRVKYE